MLEGVGMCWNDAFASSDFAALRVINPECNWPFGQTAKRLPLPTQFQDGMSIDFAFQNLIGAPYRGGAVCMFHDTLLTPVGNRVSQVRHRRPCISGSECFLPLVPGWSVFPGGC